MILLDTHAAIWIATDNGLGRKASRVIERALADDQLAVSTFSFWEVAMLIAKGRLESVTSASEHRAALLSTGLQEVQVTGEIAILAGELENFHGDPADRIITATAIAHGATLVTADANILRWKHPLKRQHAEE